jgi:hypothetical protein
MKITNVRSGSLTARWSSASARKNRDRVAAVAVWPR